MFSTPPDISLPIHNPLHSDWNRQLRMTMFFEGRPISRPSASRPALIAMASSPVRKIHSSINTLEVDSGSHPSLLG